MNAFSWWVRGALWVAVYLAAVLTPLIVLLLVPHPEGGGFWWEVAVGFGFAGLVMMGVQFLLTARFRRATDPFGIDVVYYFHRYLAYIALAIIVAHPAILVWVNPALLPALNPLRAPWEMTAGTLSIVLLLVLVVASVLRKPLGLSYEAWRVTHLLLAVGAVGTGFAHMGGIGIAPFIGMLRALADRGDRRPLLLFAAHSGWDRIPLREEVTALADRLDLRIVHVLEEPPAGWSGERGRIDREILDRHLPAERDGLEYYLCGPIPMLRAVSDLLHRVGVPDRNVHTEIFDLV